jgi:hypothetical protein
MRLLVGPDTRRRENLADRFPMRKVPPRHSSPFCPQNSGYAQLAEAAFENEMIDSGTPFAKSKFNEVKVL